MLNVKAVTEIEGLHLAHIVNQLVVADKLIQGLISAGVEITGYHTEPSKASRAWLNSICTEVATVLSTPKTLPKRKSKSPKVKAKLKKKVRK